MALKIRLAKTKNSTNYFRIVVCEARSKRDGKTVDIIGYCSLGAKPPLIKIDEKKYQKWQAVGAKPTEAVKKLLK